MKKGNVKLKKTNYKFYVFILIGSLLVMRLSNIECIQLFHEDNFIYELGLDIIFVGIAILILSKTEGFKKKLLDKE